MSTEVLLSYDRHGMSTNCATPLKWVHPCRDDTRYMEHSVKLLRHDCVVEGHCPSTSMCAQPS